MQSVYLQSGLVLALLTAVGFGGWPIFSKMSGANSFWITLIAMSISIAVACFIKIDEAGQFPSWTGVGLLTIAGIINGVALVTFAAILTGKDFEISSLIPVVNISIIVLSVIAGILLFGESITLNKMAGAATACISVYLLSR